MQERIDRSKEPQDSNPPPLLSLVERDEEPYHGFPPFEKQSDTSLAAAEQIEPHTNALQEKILGVIERAGSYGMTDEEIQAATGMNPNTARPRRRELWLKGLIGTESKRKNASNRSANVWKAAIFCLNPDATIATEDLRRCRHCGRLT